MTATFSRLMFERRIEVHIVNCSHVQSIYLSGRSYMSSIGISCKYGVCKSSRGIFGIFGIYSCHTPFIIVVLLWTAGTLTPHALPSKDMSSWENKLYKTRMRIS